MTRVILMAVTLLLVGCSPDSSADPSRADSIRADQLKAQPKPEPAKPEAIVLAKEPRKKHRFDEFWLEKVALTRDVLEVRATSGGGCKDHVYTLLSDGAFMESEPVQVNLHLSHNANQDPCEAIVGAEPKFDLTALKQAYKKAYPGGKKLILNLYGANPKKLLKSIEYRL